MMKLKSITIDGKEFKIINAEVYNMESKFISNMVIEADSQDLKSGSYSNYNIKGLLFNDELIEISQNHIEELKVDIVARSGVWLLVAVEKELVFTKN